MNDEKKYNIYYFKYSDNQNKKIHLYLQPHHIERIKEYKKELNSQVYIYKIINDLVIKNYTKKQWDKLKNKSGAVQYLIDNKL